MEKYYKREGRRFVQTEIPTVKDYRGYWYNQDGSFSKEYKPASSVGLCIIQTPTECIICMLKHIINVSYSSMQKIIDKVELSIGVTNLRIGHQEELLEVFKKYRKQLPFKTNNYYWVLLSGGNAHTGAYYGWFYFNAYDGSSDVRTYIGGHNDLLLFKSVLI